MDNQKFAIRIVNKYNTPAVLTVNENYSLYFTIFPGFDGYMCVLLHISSNVQIPTALDCSKQFFPVLNSAHFRAPDSGQNVTPHCPAAMIQ